MSAHWEEFRAALQVLVGTGPVKQRLVDAYRHHLAALREQDLPDAVRDKFVALRAAMHEAPATGGLTAPEASVRKMSEKDAAQHAAALLEMFTVLSALNETERIASVWPLNCLISLPSAGFQSFTRLSPPPAVASVLPSTLKATQ